MNKEIMPAFSLSTIISMIILWAVIHILFAILDIDDGFKGMVDSVSAMVGQDIDAVAYGSAVLQKELEFNRKAGLSKAHDRLPEFFKLEPLPPHNVTFDVPDEELDKVHGK